MISLKTRPDGIQVVDLGDLCTHCLCDTSPGSGAFVNRVPSTRHDALELPEFDGWMCADCQATKCDACSERSIDCTQYGDHWLCEECAPEEEN
jgi:hypothetical protein